MPSLCAAVRLLPGRQHQFSGQPGPRGTEAARPRCRISTMRPGPTAPSTSGRPGGWPGSRDRASSSTSAPGCRRQGNTHEVVQKVQPDARVVYVDNDPMVAAHGRPAARRRRNHSGHHAPTCASPTPCWTHPELRGLIDFGQPVGLLMTAVMHFVADERNPGPWSRGTPAPWRRAATSRCRTPTADRLPPRAVQAMYDTFTRTPTSGSTCAPGEEMERFFEGLELVAAVPGRGARRDLRGRVGSRGRRGGR